MRESVRPEHLTNLGRARHCDFRRRPLGEQIPPPMSNSITGMGSLHSAGRRKGSTAEDGAYWLSEMNGPLIFSAPTPAIGHLGALCLQRSAAPGHDAAVWAACRFAVPLLAEHGRSFHPCQYGPYPPGSAGGVVDSPRSHCTAYRRPSAGK